MDFTPENIINGAGICENAKDSFNNDKNITQMAYLSKMAAVDIEFNDVTYSVPSLRKGNQF